MRSTMYSCSSSSQCAELLKKKVTERMDKPVQCFVNKGGNWASHMTGTRWDQKYGDYYAVCAARRNTMTSDSKTIFQITCKNYATLCILGNNYSDMTCLRDAMAETVKNSNICRSSNFNLLITTGSWSWRGFTNYATSTSDNNDGDCILICS